MLACYVYIFFCIYTVIILKLSVFTNPFCNPCNGDPHSMILNTIYKPIVFFGY